MYLAALVIPVPEENFSAYQDWAKMSAAIFKRYGCLEVQDGWDDLVSRGKHTDMYRAVAAKDNEKIAISIQIWPDRDTFFASEEKMHEDGALDYEGEPPFDPARLIHGCFHSLFEMPAQKAGKPT
jgi:uncharacterized protein YbaA (DUF1428 family)